MRFAVALLLLALAACSDEDVHGCGIPDGSIVRSKLDGREGMVIRAWSHQGLIEVRFPTGQVTTDTHALGPDGPVQISPYADVYMGCFEVEVHR